MKIGRTAFSKMGSLFFQVDRFMTGKTFALVGFDEDAESELSDWISEANGELVFRDFKGNIIG